MLKSDSTGINKHETSILYLHIESYWVLILSAVYVHLTISTLSSWFRRAPYSRLTRFWPCQVPKPSKTCDDYVLQHLHFYNMFWEMSHLGVKGKKWSRTRLIFWNNKFGSCSASTALQRGMEGEEERKRRRESQPDLQGTRAVVMWT